MFPILMISDRGKGAVTGFISRASRALLLVASLLLVGQAWAALTPMSDDSLAEVTGQALVVTGQEDSGGYAFYKAGLDVEMELNANIEKLQLGCGGVNGPGCDIDIDYLSLSGPESCVGSRVNCSAVLTRPFVEFAIKNDGSPNLREVVGFRVSAENVLGLLTAGQNDGTPNGINTLSGYLDIAASSGTTETAPGTFTEPLSGLVDVGGCVAGCPRPYDTDTQGLPIASVNVPFNVGAFSVVGSRLSSVTLNATSTIPNIPIAGTRSAQLDGCFVVLFIPLCDYSINELNITGTLANLEADITIQEDLGYIHKIPVNNPFSLSLQKEALLWPGAPALAQRGWWMAFSDPINLGSLSTPAGFQVDISDTYPQVASRVTQYLTDNPLFIPFGDAVGSLFTGSYDADVGVIDLSAAAPINVNLSNLPLGTAQNVQPNCYGPASFC